MTTSLNAIFLFITGVYNVMVSNWITAVPVAITLIYLARKIYITIRSYVKQ